MLALCLAGGIAHLNQRTRSVEHQNANATSCVYGIHRRKKLLALCQSARKCSAASMWRPASDLVLLECSLLRENVTRAKHSAASASQAARQCPDPARVATARITLSLKLTFTLIAYCWLGSNKAHLIKPSADPRLPVDNELHILEARPIGQTAILHASPVRGETRDYRICHVQSAVQPNRCRRRVIHRWSILCPSLAANGSPRHSV